MSQHVNRNQVGLYVFILTAGALGLAGAGYLLGLETPSWLTIFATTGLGSLATAWRPGSQTVEPGPVEVTAAGYAEPIPTAAKFTDRNDPSQRA